MFWFIIGAAVGIFAFVLLPWPPITAAQIEYAQTRCASNAGLKQIAGGSADSVSFVCNNGATFFMNRNSITDNGARQ